jgi:hypothetical protein
MELSNSRSTEWYWYGSNRSFTPDRSSTGPDRSVPINEHTHNMHVFKHYYTVLQIKVDIKWWANSGTLKWQKFSLARAEINNENAQSDRISTMKIPKIIDFLDIQATEIFNQQIAYHLISTLTTNNMELCIITCDLVA